MRVLVTETLSEQGLELLRKDFQVDVRTDLAKGDLAAELAPYDALVIRSATQVTAAVLLAAPNLKVIARAGIGLDNIDVEEATRRGVMVVNAPQSNIISAAEQTLALLLAQARNIPQAHADLIDGRWERSKWEGVELAGKTIGLVGLGRVGSLVAARAAGFGMRVIAFDPYVSAERAKEMGVEIMPTLEALLVQSDFVSIHLPRTPETEGLIGEKELRMIKPGARLVNTARGGIVDEAALSKALEDGHLAGAALDVFAVEPTTDSPLFAMQNTVVTPHLGASTREAQDKAGDTIAEQVALALAGDFVPFAVNVAAAEASETVRPFLPLAERLGRLYVALNEGAPARIEVEYLEQLADYDTRILTLSVLKGVFGGVSEEPVSYVNAPQIAAERGIEVRDSSSSTTPDYVNLITVRGGDHAIGGTLVGLRGDPRIVMIDDLNVDLPPARYMLVVRNDDVPGMIATVASALANAKVNIGDMHLGHSLEGAAAMQVLATNEPVPPDVVEALRRADGVQSVHAISTD